MPDHFFFTVAQHAIAGFTDTLYQFNSFYKLGSVMGGKYVHTPFTSRRSGHGVFDFLRFNQSWSSLINQPEFKSKKIKKIVLGDAVLERENIRTFESLKGYVHSKVCEIQRGNGDGGIVIAFELRGRRSFFKWIHEALPERPQEYPVEAAYQALRERKSKQAVWQPEALRVLVHIRQGDTSTIRTPWNTYIPTLPWDEKRYQELNDPHQAKIYVPPSDFLDFLGPLCSHLKTDSALVRVFSDGYKAGFKEIYTHWRRYNFSLGQWVRLKWAEFFYDKKMFRAFKELPNTSCYIGESDGHLYDLIDSCLSADVIVISTQQRLLPKLLSIYYDLTRPKILIILTPDGEVDDYASVLGLAEKAVRVIPVSVKRYRFWDVFRLIAESAKQYSMPLIPQGFNVEEVKL